MEEKSKYVRPSWDEYFLGLLEPLSKRATCDRGRVAALIVSSQNTILTTGYAGSPPGQPHCDEVGHMLKTVTDEQGNKSQHCLRTIHAEQNTILQAAKNGIRLEGATLYVTMIPCYACSMSIVRAGINRIVAKKKYHAGAQSIELFEKAGVKVDILEDSVVEYKNQ